MSNEINMPQSKATARADWFDSRDLHIRAARSFRNMVATGAEHYDRVRILPKLMPMSEEDLRAGRWTDARIIHALERAVRRERQNGRGRHWTYDINRHISLIQALKAERRAAQIKTMRARKAAKLQGE